MIVEKHIDITGEIESGYRYLAQVEGTRCTACAMCQKACPFAAIEMNRNAQVNWEACMGCGVCVG
jgi:heterodisulfide reductase subunit A-like polyferredoxin